MVVVAFFMVVVARPSLEYRSALCTIASRSIRVGIPRNRHRGRCQLQRLVQRYLTFAPIALAFCANNEEIYTGLLNLSRADQEELAKAGVI
jgi:hypothetical protein